MQNIGFFDTFREFEEKVKKEVFWMGKNNINGNFSS